MNSNRSSNQSQGKANGKNSPKKNSSARNGAKDKNRAGKQVRAMVGQARVGGTGLAEMRSMDSGGIRVRHREYITDISASTGSPSIFNVALNGSINPGLASMFPWLSSIASRFESYHFNQLRFSYETEAPNTLGGTVVISADFDASDSAPVSKQQAMGFKGAVRTAPWAPVTYTCRPDQLNKLKSHYVRSGALAANQDVKLYDIGNVFLITQNVTTASAVCGELYVEYDVEFLTPSLDPVQLSGTAFAAAGTAAAPFPATTVYLGGLGLSGSGTTLTVTNLTVGQEYMVCNGGVGCTSAAQGAVTGWTLKTAVVSAVLSAWSTYTATATTATVVIQVTGATSNVSVCVCSIPVSTF